MTVIKRNRQDSASDLVAAIEKLNVLLRDQGEDEAVEQLKKAAQDLRKNPVGSPGQMAAVNSIIDVFEGEQELMAYTMQRNSTEWTEAEELSQASSRVLSLARRMRT